MPEQTSYRQRPPLRMRPRPLRNAPGEDLDRGDLTDPGFARGWTGAPDDDSQDPAERRYPTPDYEWQGPSPDPIEVDKRRRPTTALREAAARRALARLVG